jgi:hypothetical protein
MTVVTIPMDALTMPSAMTLRSGANSTRIPFP